MKTYTYDAADQLTGVAFAAGTPEAFTYDDTGNRTMAGYSTGTGNRLTSDGVYSYTYDDEGNTLTKSKTGERWEYSWDYRNRMTEVKKLTGAGGTLLYEADYTYDAFDRRVGILKDADGAGGGAAVQTWTLYDGDNAWSDFNGAGTLTVRYLNGLVMDERYARVKANGDVAWYLGDNLGSVRQVVETDGTVLDALTYSAFGTILTETNAGNGDRFKYTGREWDAGTGQYYYRARYYGADAGRFRSEDPIGFAGGDANVYRYVGNNNISQTDPTGLSPDNPPRDGSDRLTPPPPFWTIEGLKKFLSDHAAWTPPDNVADIKGMLDLYKDELRALRALLKQKTDFDRMITLVDLELRSLQAEIDFWTKKIKETQRDLDRARRSCASSDEIDDLWSENQRYQNTYEELSAQRDALRRRRRDLERGILPPDEQNHVDWLRFAIHEYERRIAILEQKLRGRRQ